MNERRENELLAPKPQPNLVKVSRCQPSARQVDLARASLPVPHLGEQQVRELARAAYQKAAEGGSRGRSNAERDELFILTLFDGALRVSEALQLSPERLVRTEGGYRVRILGKSGRWEKAAVSASLAARLHAYAYRKRLSPSDRLFPFSRQRAHQVVREAFKVSGLAKPDGVGTVHVLRHSGAIERLRRTGNPRAVQEQLRHRSAVMTLRYLRTLSAEEALRIQEAVDYAW